MNKQELLQDIDSRININVGPKGITPTGDNDLRKRTVYESVAKVLNRSTALVIGTTSDSHFIWWGNTINIQGGISITLTAGLPDGYMIHVFATGQNGSVVLPADGGTVTISYQKKLRYTFAHLGDNVYRVFEEPTVSTPGGEAQVISGFEPYVNESFSIYAERRQYLFHTDGEQNTTIDLMMSDGGAGETSLAGLNDIALGFSNFGAGERTFNLNGLTVINDEGAAVEGNIILKKGQKIALTSTKTLDQLRIEGQYAAVTPTLYSYKSLINLQGKNQGPAPFPWSNMATYPSGAQIELIDTGTGDTTLQWIMRLPTGTNFQTGGGTGPSTGVGEFIPEVSREYGYLSSAPSAVYTFEFESLGTAFADTDRFKITILSAITTTGGRNGLFYAGEIPAGQTIATVGTLKNSAVTPYEPFSFENVAPVNGILTLHFAQASTDDICVINGIILEKTA